MGEPDGESEGENPTFPSLVGPPDGAANPDEGESVTMIIVGCRVGRNVGENSDFVLVGRKVGADLGGNVGREVETTDESFEGIFVAWANGDEDTGPFEGELLGIPDGCCDVDGFLVNSSLGVGEIVGANDMEKVSVPNRTPHSISSSMPDVNCTSSKSKSIFPPSRELIFFLHFSQSSRFADDDRARIESCIL